MIEYIKICSFFNKNRTVIIEVAKIGYDYFYINYKGELSHRYNTLSQAKEDIKDLFGKKDKFKMLI